MGRMVNVTAQVELIIELPEGVHPSVTIVQELKDAIKAGRWVNVTGARVVYERQSFEV